MKFICLLNSYDSGNSLISTSVTLGKDSASRTYKAAEANTNYAVYVVISSNGNFTGSNVAYEQKQEYAIKYKSADYTFSNFVCNTAETSTKAGTVASVAQGTNTTYTKDYIVEDERDNKYYIVRKLYMRNDAGTISTACWMTQNLDLDIVAMKDSEGTGGDMYAYNTENNTIQKLTTTNTNLSDHAWKNIAKTATGSTVTGATTATVMNTQSLFATNTCGNARSCDWNSNNYLQQIAPVTTYTANPTTSTVSKITPTNKNLSTDTSTYNNPGMLDPGVLLYGPFDKTRSLADADSSLNNWTRSWNYCSDTQDEFCDQFTNTRYFGANHLVSTASVGNFYNWYAATAGMGNSNNTTQYDKMTDSLCPAGWRLASGRSGASTSGDFGELAMAYFTQNGLTFQREKTNSSATFKVSGGTYALNGYSGYSGVSVSGTYNYLPSNSDLFLTSEPVSAPRAGSSNASSSTGSLGLGGYYWSSSVYSSSNAYYLSFVSANLYPGTSSDARSSGFTLRCVQGV